jgi:hypothetical protein
MRGGVPMEGTTHHVESRRANELKAAGSPPTDPQGLVEFSCECARSDCERSVRMPLDVYRRVLVAGNQFVLQTGHHASTSYRTIISIGLTSIEESV